MAGFSPDGHVELDRAALTSLPTRDRSAPRCVAVVDGCPARRRGLGTALSEAGFRVVAIRADVGVWLGTVDHSMALIWAGDAAGEAELRAAAHLSPQSPIVAILHTESLQAWRQALRAGAISAVFENADLHEIVAVVQGAAEGRTVLPPAIARALAEVEVPNRMPSVVEEEVQWLRALADGTTIAQLARMTARSERALYRHLAALYRKLGSTTKSEALLAASRRGLI